MHARVILAVVMLGGWLGSQRSFAEEISAAANASATIRTFSAQGVIQQIEAAQRTVVIKHQVITNYMAAMTMPFKVKDSHLLAGFQPGDEILFRLTVTADESWVDQFHKIGTAPVDVNRALAATTASLPPPGSFIDYALTNELGQKVTLRDFHGQALAITFFYTRCPLPDFCPRLSKNFKEAAEKLRHLAGGPANWHFLSISFDTEVDTPAMLKAYGESFGYHPDEWSFLTGSPADIKELARISGVTYTASGGGFQHNFRTLIVDATGRLQMIFPMGGDISADIVTEILKAAKTNNQPNLSIRVH